MAHDTGHCSDPWCNRIDSPSCFSGTVNSESLRPGLYTHKLRRLSCYLTLRDTVSGDASNSLTCTSLQRLPITSSLLCCSIGNTAALGADKPQLASRISLQRLRRPAHGLEQRQDELIHGKALPWKFRPARSGFCDWLSSADHLLLSKSASTDSMAIG